MCPCYICLSAFKSLQISIAIRMFFVSLIVAIINLGCSREFGSVINDLFLSTAFNCNCCTADLDRNKVCFVYNVKF